MTAVDDGAGMADRVRWVETDEAFEALCSAAHAAGQVALDTEFERTDTYFPRLALLQFAIGEQIHLVDPLALSSPTPLRRLLADPSVEKVLHAVGEDLEVLHTWCGEGLEVASLVDTQLAAAFLGHRYGISYRELVSHLTGVTLEKGETRSDWLARPLTDSQRHYAAMDVAWLLPMWWQMRAQLERLGRLDWVREDCALAVSDAAQRTAPEEMWRLVKRAVTLDARATAALQRLAAWRELRARELDRPRTWILRDEELIRLAEQLPERPDQLQGKPLAPGLVKRSGTELQAQLNSVRRLPDERLPQPLQVLSRAEGEQLQKLRKAARARAVELGIAEELLARKKLLEPLLLEPAAGLPPALQGWRLEVMGDLLEAWRR